MRQADFGSDVTQLMASKMLGSHRELLEIERTSRCQRGTRREVPKVIEVVQRPPLMTAERRSYARTNLRVPLFLLPMKSSVPVRTETENVGTNGFFCYSEYLFSPGENLKFLLFLPAAANDPGFPMGMCVYGEVQVIRVVIMPLRCTYGIGCHMINYRILPEPGLLSLDELVATVFETDCR